MYVSLCKYTNYWLVLKILWLLVGIPLWVSFILSYLFVKNRGHLWRHILPDMIDILIDNLSWIIFWNVQVDSMHGWVSEKSISMLKLGLEKIIDVAIYSLK